MSVTPSPSVSNTGMNSVLMTVPSILSVSNTCNKRNPSVSENLSSLILFQTICLWVTQLKIFCLWVTLTNGGTLSVSYLEQGGHWSSSIVYCYITADILFKFELCRQFLSVWYLHFYLFPEKKNCDIFNFHTPFTDFIPFSGYIYLEP